MKNLVSAPFNPIKFAGRSFYFRLTPVLTELLSIPVAATQTTYTFMHCGATGNTGPNQGQVNTAYNSTNLNGLVSVTGQGIQQWVVPGAGNDKSEGWGAQGGKC